MKGKINIASFVLSLGAIIFVAIFILENSRSHNNIAYFDFNKVYNECSLKSELEKDLERVVTSRNSELDSLNISLTYLSSKSDNSGLDEEESDEFEFKKARFYSLQEKYAVENQNLKSQFFQKIKIMINKKAVDFAQEQGIDLMLSANGDGSVMYGVDEIDITKEFLKYVNQDK